MSSTATNYINLIRKDYPVRGRDNDSQGFRDNFTNIAEAIKFVNQDVEDLRNTAVLTNSTATFYGNTVKEANFQNCSTELWDNGTLSGNIVVDYTLGSYQKLTVEANVNNITIINWPDEGKSGHLLLSIYPSSVEGVYSVNFVGANITSLGPSKNPYQLLANVNVFELYSEYSAGSDDNVVHTRLLNELTQVSTSTDQITADRLFLNNKKVPSEGQGSNLTYRASSSTGALTATVVQSTMVGNNVIANIALVPNKVVHTIVDIDPTGYVSTNTATKIQLNSIEGILTGAKFNLLNNTASFTVTATSVINNIISVNPAFVVGIGNGDVIFKNPTFGDQINGLQVGEKTAFPTLVTLLDGNNYLPANTSTGRIGVFKGSIYASANTLEVTYADPEFNIKNTFTASTMPVTTVTDNSFNLANTMFVHMLLPAGSIIMWYGLTVNVPYGWGLCDGTVYDNLSYPGDTSKRVRSPDLRNKFVVGANATTVWNGDDALNSRVATSTITGASTSTGGRSDLAVTVHNHEVTATITALPHAHFIDDPGHNHVLTNLSGVLAGDGVARADIDSDDRLCLFGNYELRKNSFDAETGIIIESTVTEMVSVIDTINSGTSTPVTNKDNIPPYVALCYIIKITGD